MWRRSERADLEIVSHQIQHAQDHTSFSTTSCAPEPARGHGQASRLAESTPNLRESVGRIGRTGSSTSGGGTEILQDRDARFALQRSSAETARLASGTL